ncbi:hypothetical protein B0H34DRAFT_810689 [Crassisporium funariophilum]|nr:hypothetical protein B0H34DRAFT_810689 [Crassisporium funariophilum]
MFMVSKHQHHQASIFALVSRLHEQCAAFISSRGSDAGSSDDPMDSLIEIIRTLPQNAEDLTSSLGARLNDLQSTGEGSTSTTQAQSDDCSPHATTMDQNTAHVSAPARGSVMIHGSNISTPPSSASIATVDANTADTPVSTAMAAHADVISASAAASTPAALPDANVGEGLHSRVENSESRTARFSVFSSDTSTAPVVANIADNAVPTFGPVDANIADNAVSPTMVAHADAISASAAASISAAIPDTNVGEGLHSRVENSESRTARFSVFSSDTSTAPVDADIADNADPDPFADYDVLGELRRRSALYPDVGRGIPRQNAFCMVLDADGRPFMIGGLPLPPRPAVSPPLFGNADSLLWGFLHPVNPRFARVNFYRSQPKYCVGRHPDFNQVILPGGHVSDKHAVMEWLGGSRVTIRDFSSNGTYINRRRTCKYEPCPLKDGDEISFGLCNPGIDGYEDYPLHDTDTPLPSVRPAPAPSNIFGIRQNNNADYTTNLGSGRGNKRARDSREDDEEQARPTTRPRASIYKNLCFRPLRSPQRPLRSPQRSIKPEISPTPAKVRPDSGNGKKRARDSEGDEAEADRSFKKERSSPETTSSRATTKRLPGVRSAPPTPTPSNSSNVPAQTQPQTQMNIIPDYQAASSSGSTSSSASTSASTDVESPRRSSRLRRKVNKESKKQ